MLSTLLKSFWRKACLRQVNSGRRPVRTRTGFRTKLECLEDRFLPSSTELFGGLEFMGTFATNNNVVSSTTAVQVGVAPAKGASFTPLLQLDDGVQFTTTDSTGTFTTNGTVSVLTGGTTLPLLNGQNYTFTGPGLLGSNYFTLPSGSDNSTGLSVAGGSLAASALHLSAQELDLQGSLSLPALAGLNLGVSGTNHVAITPSSVSLTGLGVTVAGPTTVTVDGLPITFKNLQVEYSSTNNEFEASGSASVTVAGNTVSLTLGTSSDPGLDVVNGSLQSLNATVNVSGDDASTPFEVAGVSFGLTSATFEYNSTTQTFGIGAAASFEADGQSVDVTLGDSGDPGLVIQAGSLISLKGSVTSNIEIGDLTLKTQDLTVSWASGGDVSITGEASIEADGESIDLALGSMDSGGTMQDGIAFNPTTGQLDSLNAVVNSTIAIGPVTIKAQDLSIHYSSGNPDLSISGSASFELDDNGGDTPSQSVDLTLGDGSGTTGILIDTSTGTLVSLDASITSDLSIAGLDIKADDLTVDYQSSSSTSGDVFTVSGSASFAWEGNSVQLSLAKDTGLVITNGQLTSLNASVTSNLNLLGITLDVNDLTFEYMAASGNTPEQFALYGGISIQSSIFNFSTTLGTASDPGLEISNGQLENLNITVDGGFSLDGINVSANGLTIQYSSANNELDLSGGVTLDFTSAFQISASIGGGGLLINPSTGSLSISSSGLSIMGSATLGPFSVNANVAFSNGANGINLSVSGMVDLPGGIDVGIEKFDIVNGQLADIGLSYTATAPSLGIPIADTGFYITALSGELDNLNNPSQIVVSASATVDFGEKFSVPNIPGIFSGGDFSLIEATGSITVSAQELDLSGSVTILGGLLGQGTASVDLNWGTGIYMVSGNFGIFDNIITFGGSLTITSQGDVYAEAMASVNIPPQVPFIGGTSLANINFALDYVPSEPSNDSYVAVWTNVNIFVASFTIGFKIDFAGDFNLIDGNDVQQIQATISTVSEPSFYSYTSPVTISGQNVVGANIVIDSPSFLDYTYAESGTYNDTVDGEDLGGYQFYQLTQQDAILPTMQLGIYALEGENWEELGTGTFDSNGNFQYTENPNYPTGYQVTHAVVSPSGLVQLLWNVDPGQTYITASYETANGAYLELQQENTSGQWVNAGQYAIDPIATPNAGSVAAGADDEMYTDTLTASTATEKGGIYLNNFTLSQGSPDTPSMVVNVYSGSSVSGEKYLGQVTFPNGIYHFTPASSTSLTPVGGIVNNGILSLDWEQNPGAITVEAMYRSVTDRVINVNLADDTVPDGVPGMYQVELVQPYPLYPTGTMPTFSESLEYAAPTVGFSGTPKMDASGNLDYTVDASAFTPQSQQSGDTTTTVSIYCNSTNSTTGGTLIDTLDYSEMTPVNGQSNERSANLTWSGFQGLKAGNYYLYAVVSDGQTAPQYSTVSGPITATGPVPMLSAPADIILTPTAGGTEQGVFSAADGTALGATINTTNPLTVTVTVNGGGKIALPGGTPAATLTQTYTTIPTSVLDGLTFTSDGTFSGGTTLTYTASQSFVDVANGGTGYQSVPTVTFTSSDGNGSGMTGYAVVANGQVTAVVITNPGTGYDAAPYVAFSGGDPMFPASATYITESASKTISLVVPNTHLLVTQTVSGSVSGVTVMAGGSGYQSAPTVTFSSSDGNGSGAAGYATVANGKVTSVTITDSGVGYDAPPVVSFSGGNPTTLATATATIIMPPANPDNAYLSIAVSDPGGPDNQAGTNVQVQDYLSPGLTILAATPSQGTFDPNTGIWTIGNLSSGSNPVTLSLTLQAASGTADTPLTSTADASSTLPNFPITDAQSTAQVLPVSHNIVISPATLPAATEGSPYEMTLSADGGGGGPYTFTLASGTLPAGITLAANGALSGTSTVGGTYSFTVTATGPTGVSSTVPLQLIVANTSLAVVGTPYSLSVPYVDGGEWSVSSGTLPPGLSLSVVNFYATVIGTPTTPGTYTFDIQERRSGGQLTTTDSYTIVVDSVLMPSQAPLPAACVGCSYSVPFMAMGGSGNYIVSLASGTLPAGLSFSGTMLSGTIAPTVTPGSYPITVAFQDQEGQIVTQTYTLQVDNALGLSPTTLPAATIGSPYSQQLTASGGSGTGYLFNLTGTLPPGLTLAAAGVIGGTIPAGSLPSPATFTVTVTDSAGNSVSQQYALAVDPAVTIGPSVLPAVGVGQAYSETLSATGGDGSGYTFALQSGTLPAGLVLSTSGTINGTVTPGTAGGYYPFTVEAADSAGDTGSLSYSLFVDAGETISPSLLPATALGTAYSQQLTATGGSGSYTFALAGGTLPAGLNLSASGLVSGTVSPTATAGTYTFTVAVTDALGVSTNSNLSLSISPASETWTGAVSNAWSNPANWSGHFIPAGGVNVVIPTKPAGGWFPALNVTATTYNLTIQAGARLNLAGHNITTDGTLTNQGTVVLEGTEQVTLASGNDVKEGTWLYIGDGTGHTLTLPVGNYFNLEIDDLHTEHDVFEAPATLTVNGGLTISCGTLSAAGGTITSAGVSLLSTGVLDAPSVLADSGNFTITGGTFNADEGLVEFTSAGLQELATGGRKFSGIAHTGSGTLILSGSGLTATGSLTNAAGNFQVNNLSVAVAGSTTLSGGTFDAGKSALLFKGGLTLDGGNFEGGSGTVTVGDVTIEQGTLTAPSILIDTGNWTHSGGTFTAGGGTVDLTGTGQTISGSTTFHNLTKAVNVADTLTFQSGSTQTVTGRLTLAGTSAHLLDLRSSEPGTDWDLDPLGVINISFVDVEDSQNAAKADISAARSVNAGDDTGWLFPGSGK